MPVTFGGKAEFADVLIKNVPGLDATKISVLHPGAEALRPLSADASHGKDGAVRLHVPLVRGCAMVLLRI
jgi:hypothetical protein